MKNLDVIIVGAGAAGLMCAIEAGKRGKNVLVLDQSNMPGKKILMSGGGRCNFTNYYTTPDNFISHNPHFCKSALSRYSPWDFIDLVKKHQIPFHEKTLGQLFCDNKSKEILDMLLSECQQVNVEIKLNIHITDIKKTDDHYFKIRSNQDTYTCKSLVIATGGLSIPTLGSSPFGYQIAEQFGINVWPTRAGLVPLTLHMSDKEKFSTISGVSTECVVQANEVQFRENILFTHRGLSGPAILQISSYWHPGEEIKINLLPDINVFDFLKHAQQYSPHKQLKNIFTEFLPKRLLEIILDQTVADEKILSISNNNIRNISNNINSLAIKPNSTEGYRTAEVTLGGVDCNAISSKTMEANDIKGLYFIGEVLDVTGWLGGYNFQWAWSSGWAAGQVV